MWKCEHCSAELSGCEDWTGNEVLLHNEDTNEKPSCVVCNNKMVWIHREDKTITLPMFDYTFQVYRNETGDVVKREHDYDFPCNRCQSPGKLEDVNAYYELYICLNNKCKKTIKVS